MKLLTDQELLAPWIVGLPDGWKAPRIDDFSDVFFSNVDKHTIEGELPARLCNYVDVYKNEKITHEIEFMEASADAYELERFQIRKGDVLLTKDSEEPDDIAIASLVAEDLPGVICGYHLALIRSRSRSIKGSFLAWVHKSKPFRAQYEAKAVGITRFGLSQYAFRSARIPLPVQDEQDRISAYLDKQCAAIDKVLETKREQLTVLEDLRKSIIHKAVTKGLDDSAEMKDSGIERIGKMPKNWKMDRIKDVVSLSNTKTDEKDEIENYIELEDMDQKTGRLLSIRNTIGVESDVIVFEKGDVLFGKLRPYLEKHHYAEFNGRCTGEIFAFKPERIDGKYFYYCVASPWFISRCDVLSYGAKMPRVNWPTQIAVMDIPIPSCDEQVEIAKFLDKEIKGIFSLMDNIKQQIDVLEGYRKSLIHECVTGKRRISEQDLKELANV